MLPGVQNKTKKVLHLIFSHLYVSLMIKVKHFKKNSYICFSTRQDYYIMAKLKISNTEVEQLSNASAYIFPKYTSQIINWANQNAQGTRPKVVGQMSDLIQEFDGTTLNEWINWYDNKMPNAIDDATEKIYDMLIKIKNASQCIDKEMVKNWVKDLVYTKTFCGLRVQQAILSFLANKFKRDWKLATRDEEARGIDGYIGTQAVQIKSATYKVENNLNEIIPVPIIYYEKKKDGIVIEFEQTIFQ